MSRRTDVMRVGAEPRANLLPPAVRVRQRWRVWRSQANVAVVIVLAVAVAATGLAYVYNLQAQSSLAAAQNQTSVLIAGQGKYAEVQQLRTEISELMAARRVGSATEVDWESYLTKLGKTLPSSVSLVTVGVQSASPMQPVPQAASVLAKPRVAVLSLQAKGEKLSAIKSWIDSLASLKGFAGLSVSQIQADDSDYTVTLTLSVNADAYSGRFQTSEDEPSGASGSGSGTGTQAAGDKAEE